MRPWRIWNPGLASCSEPKRSCIRRALIEFGRPTWGATWKKTWGHHSLLAFLDRREIADGEALAGLLGVQRTTVNAVARGLQEEGLIGIRRGGVQVVDRVGLKRRTCECYAAVEEHFAGVIGGGGTGGRASRD